MGYPRRSSRAPMRPALPMSRTLRVCDRVAAQYDAYSADPTGPEAKARSRVAPTSSDVFPSISLRANHRRRKREAASRVHSGPSSG